MSERKDIDAIVGATVKLEESLNKRISELEKNGERDYLNIDANRDQINANLEGIEDCWKELKEKLDGKKGSGGEKEMVNKGIGDDSLVDKPELIRLSSNERVLDLKEGIPSIHSKPPEPSCDTCKNKLNLPKTKCAVDGCDMFSRYEPSESDPVGIIREIKDGNATVEIIPATITDTKGNIWIHPKLLIAEFVDDLCNLQGIGKILYQYEPLRALIKKWEARSK